MAKKILSIILFSFSFTAFCTTWTITNSGISFSPSNLTITFGDDVNFVLSSIHNALEVSQSTWNSNGNTALSGGFQTNFGGGLVPTSQLAVGTHYFVCSPHASSGMKGIIIVQSSAGIIENKLSPLISIFPNPNSGKFQLNINGLHYKRNYNLEIYDLRSQIIFIETNLMQQKNYDIDLSTLEKGIYVLKFHDGIDVFIRKILIN